MIFLRRSFLLLVRKVVSVKMAIKISVVRVAITGIKSMVSLKRIALHAQKVYSVMHLVFWILRIHAAQVISAPNLVTLKNQVDVILKMPQYVRLDISVTMENNEDLALLDSICQLKVQQTKAIVSTAKEIVPMKR